MNGRTKRFITLLGAVAMISALLVPFAPQALANHTNYTLEVTPEVGEEAPGGGSLTLTARITCQPNDDPEECDAVSPLNPINIDFELEGGANDTDGNTPTTPDRTCEISGVVDDPTTGRDETRECTVSFSGNNVGQDFIRAWIDHDKVQTTVEADTTEGRYAGPTDCQDNEEGCVDGTPVPGSSPLGSQCPAVTSATQEPDCTDRVVVNTSAASTDAMDCDDPSGPDTERQKEPSTPGANNDPVVYICTVVDQAGNPVSGETVQGENESTVNDPDTPDSSSYNSPDYACSTPTNEDGNCAVTVTDVEGEYGTASICFYIPSGIASIDQADCADEETGEGQEEDGSDEPNDFSDRVELTWLDAGTAETLDCNPETATNPVGAQHVITCKATDVNGAAVAGVVVDMEITGAGDPDMTNSTLLPDDTCITENDGECEFTHTSGSEGTTTYRAWIDEDDDDLTFEGDSAETQEQNDGDNTDVVTKTWTGPPDSVVMTPESDSAEVGDCNPYTIEVKDGEEPRAGITVDVEQRHEDSGNSDEPTVSYCTPSTGPNPSAVDTTRGDLGPNSSASDKENPDQKGTAGGETSKTTDSNGQITIGIRVAASSTNDGSGLVNIVAWFEGTDNDDPDDTDPKDTSSKTWQAAAGEGGRTITCTPETATRTVGQDHTVTCTVRDADGLAEDDVDVSFTETGPGSFKSSPQDESDNQGQVSVVVTSTENGTQTVTATITNSTQNEPDTDECDRAAGDPAGSPAGVCSDSVTVTWEGATECSDGVDNDGDGRTDYPADAGCSDETDDTEAGEPQCEDGQDNDSDGATDFPDDEGCESAEDDDESDDQVDETCPGYANDPRNQVVGTDGDDQLTGTEGDDIICGLDGNDDIDGLGGDDLILGGNGNDSLRGGDGNDEIYGEGGKDELRGNSGNDLLDGGDQNDVLIGNTGNDTLIGASGFDVIKGGGGNDTGKGGSGRDTLQGYAGSDVLKGGGGVDVVKGGNGADRLNGGGGNDTIAGNKGKDRINGGPGRDTCNGGPGKDRIRNCEAGRAKRSGR